MESYFSDSDSDSESYSSESHHQLFITRSRSRYMGHNSSRDRKARKGGPYGPTARRTGPSRAVSGLGPYDPVTSRLMSVLPTTRLSSHVRVAVQPPTPSKSDAVHSNMAGGEGVTQAMIRIPGPEKPIGAAVLELPKSRKLTQAGTDVIKPTEGFPVAQSPVKETPVRSLNAQSPVKGSPVTKSPVKGSPVAQSPFMSLRTFPVKGSQYPVPGMEPSIKGIQFRVKGTQPPALQPPAIATQSSVEVPVIRTQSPVKTTQAPLKAPHWPVTGAQSPMKGLFPVKGAQSPVKGSPVTKSLIKGSPVAQSPFTSLRTFPVKGSQYPVSGMEPSLKGIQSRVKVTQPPALQPPAIATQSSVEVPVIRAHSPVKTTQAPVKAPQWPVTGAQSPMKGLFPVKDAQSPVKGILSPVMAPPVETLLTVSTLPDPPGIEKTQAVPLTKTPVSTDASAAATAPSPRTSTHDSTDRVSRAAAPTALPLGGSAAPVGGTIVCDNGSGVIKAGLAGESAPRVLLPALVGSPRVPAVMLTASPKENYVGDEAQRLRGVLSLRHPTRRGVVVDWDDAGRLWAAGFAALGGARDRRLLLTECPLNPRANRERMLEVAFEAFGVDACYVAVQAVLALYAAGATTGLVVDSGDEVTHTVPVYEGYCLPHVVSRLNLGGRDLSRYLARILTERGVALVTSAEAEIARDMKERLGYVAADFEAELDRPPPAEPYVLPDGQTVELGSERFRCAEPLFTPALVGVEGRGVAHDTFDSIMRCDIDLRRALFANIVLAGGSSCFPGTDARLRRDVAALAPAAVDVRCTPPSARRELAAWLGGSVLAAMDGFAPLWIQRQEYEEFGPRIVHRKCF